MGYRKGLILFDLWGFIYTYKLINFNTLRDKMMKFNILAQPVNKSWVICTLTVMIYVQVIPEYFVSIPTRQHGTQVKYKLLKGRRAEWNVVPEPFTKGTFKHLSNFKGTSGGGTMVSNHLLGFWFGNRSTRKTGHGRGEGEGFLLMRKERFKAI